MSGQTIRDVVIKVSIEAGDTSSLKSMAKDTKSAFDSLNPGSKSVSSNEYWDKEAAAAIKSYSKILAERKKAEIGFSNNSHSASHNLNAAHKDRSAAMSNAASNGMNFLKGAASIVNANDQQAASFVRTISEIQGYYHALQSGFSVIRAFQDMSKASIVIKQSETAANLAATASQAKGGAGAAAAGGSAAGAVPPVPVAALANPYVAVAAAVVAALAAGLYVWRTLAKEARALKEDFHQQQIDNTNLVSQENERRQETFGRHSATRTKLQSTRLEARDTARQTLNRIQESASVEKQSRAYESDLNHSTAEQRHESREYRESQSNNKLAMNEARSAEIRHRHTLASLKSEGHRLSHPKTIQMIENTHIAERKRISDAQQNLKANPDGWLGGHTAEQQSTMMRLNEQMVQSGLSQAQAVAAVKQKILENTQAQIDAEAGVNASLADQHRALKAMQQTAYSRLQSVKQSKHDKNVEFGMMTPGEQQRVLMIQRKHDEIKRRKEENLKAGRDEWEGVPMLTQQEMQDARGEATISVKAQAERTGVKLGYRTGEEKPEKDAQDNFEKVQSFTEPKMKEKESQIKASGEKTEQLADRLAKQMEDTFNVERLVDQLIAKLKQLKSDNAHTEFGNSTYTNGGVGA